MTFIVASTSPNAVTILSRGGVQCVCHGLRQAMRTPAEARMRSHATPAAGTFANSSTASAAPMYCETAAMMKSPCGGSLSSGAAGAGRSMALEASVDPPRPPHNPQTAWSRRA